MKKIALVLAGAFLALTVTAQRMTDEEFSETFKKGILHLSNNKLQLAEENFKTLHQEDEDNKNVTYLLGQAYARQGEQLPKAIELLKSSIKAYTPNYRKTDPTEKRVSEYAYYYLLMAYSKNGDCDKTLDALNQFYTVYSYENEWYLVDAQELFRNCKPKEPEAEPEEQIVQEEKQVKKDEPEPYKYPEQKHIIGTKNVQYTYKGTEWGIQVAAVLDPVYTYEFPGLRNIEVYMDNNGVYRYIIGHFMFKSQAERLLKLIQKKGYNDAFLVNVKDKQKFSEQVITIDQDNVNKKIVGKIDFRVQIGAFRGDTIPDHLMEIYLKLDSISETQVNDLTIMTVGSFDTYEEASFYKELVQDLGVKDAFVAAFNYNRKVDLRHAIMHIKEQQKAIENRKKKESETSSP